MVEKKRSLTVSTTFTDFGDLDEKKKDDIKKYFPIYFSDDLEYMKEEVNFSYPPSLFIFSLLLV